MAAARELKDRWLEQVNATPLIGHAKYEVSRLVHQQRAERIAVPSRLIEPSIAA